MIPCGSLGVDDLYFILSEHIGKKCFTCDKYKILCEYNIDFHKKDGYKDNCKDCYKNCIKLTTLNNLKCYSEFCDEKGYIKYDKYCKHCFINLFPTDSRFTNYIRKEKLVYNFLKKYYCKRITKSFNQTIENGFLKYRPDILINLSTHAIIVEIDENQHKNDDYSCENKRICTIISELGQISCVFIRFNTDKYSLKNGAIYESCFKKNNYGVIEISNKIDWENRLEKLKETIDINICNIPKKSITTIYLFYDE